jgi:hypothetical protein
MRRQLKIVLLLFLVQGSLVAPLFAQDDKRIASVVLLDNTGSLRTQLSFEKDLGKALVENAILRGPVSVLHFRTDDASRQSRAKVSIGVDWGRTETFINRHIDGLFTVPGQTTLLDAIYFAAEQAAAKSAHDKLSETVIYLVSDGEDRASERRAGEVIAYLKQNKIKVFAVGLVNELPPGRGFISKSPGEKARSFLKDLTEETGGRVVFPTKKQTSKAVVDELLSVAPPKKK